MQQQTLHELLQDLEQELLRSHVLVIKSVGLQITMQSKSDWCLDYGLLTEPVSQVQK